MPTRRPTLWQRRSPGEQHDSSKCLERIREECVKERTSERFRTSVLGLNWSSKPLTAGSGGPLTLEIQAGTARASPTGRAAVLPRVGGGHPGETSWRPAEQGSLTEMKPQAACEHLCLCLQIWPEPHIFRGAIIFPLRNRLFSH